MNTIREVETPSVTRVTDAPSLTELGERAVEQLGEYQRLNHRAEESREQLGKTLHQIHQLLAKPGKGKWRQFLEDRHINHMMAWRILTWYRKERLGKVRNFDKGEEGTDSNNAADVNSAKVPGKQRHEIEFNRLVTWGRMFLKPLDRQVRADESRRLLKAWWPGTKVSVRFTETKEKVVSIA